jgi:uncharacterized membrane protein YesL
MGRTVRFLGAGTDLLTRALLVQAVWLVGTLAGGVVFGLAPATVTATEAAACAARDEKIRVSALARTWRDCFLRSQVALGLPILFLVLGAAAALSGVLPRALVVAVIIAAIGLMIAMLHLPSVELHYEVPASRALSRSFALAVAQAPTTLIMLAVLALWAGICWKVPGLLPFLGVGVPVLFVQYLAGRSVQRNDDLLAAQADDPSAVPSQPPLTRADLARADACAVDPARTGQVARADGGGPARTDLAPGPVVRA